MMPVIAKWMVVASMMFLVSSCGSGSSSPEVVAKDATISEAGYYKIDPFEVSFQQDQVDTIKLTSGTARIFYSYHPAKNAYPGDRSSTQKPLFVMLNGGPGCATTCNLFSMNTAPYTLDREHQQSASRIAVNHYSWAQMGNLLYIDAPNTGFSYNMIPGPDRQLARLAEFAAHNFNPFTDAAQVLRVLLRFLKEHEEIRKNPVILVGESYGGIRVSTMMNLLLFYPHYADGSKIFKDEGLKREIEDHFKDVFKGKNPVFPLAPATVASQFGRQILVQPQLTAYQSEITGDMYEQKGSVIDQIAAAEGKTYYRQGGLFCKTLTGECSTKETCAIMCNVPAFNRDRYNYSKTKTWSDDLEAFAINGLLDVSVLTTALQYNVDKINELRPAERSEAFRYINNGRPLLEADMDQLLSTMGGSSENLSPTATAFFYGQSESILYIEGLVNRSGSNTLVGKYGALEYWDDYFVSTNNAVYLAFTLHTYLDRNGYKVNPDSSTLYGQMFLENLLLVNTFLTDAEYDLVIYSPAIPEALKRYSDIVSTVQAVRGTNESPLGSFKIGYKQGTINGVSTHDVELYYPYYATAGHSVSSGQPDKFLADVQAWMQK